MKIIIDTDKKELGAEDVITMGQLHEFLEKHGLLDYGLMGVKPDGPSIFPVKFAPNPLGPPWRITSTGGPITVIPGSTSATVSHIDQDLKDTEIEFGCQRIDSNKHHTPYIYRNDPRLAGVEELKKLVDGIQ